jgi:hypothetical protein
MINVLAGMAVWWERFFITTFCFAYLVIFNRVVPHGDALRVVRQIEDSHLIWNPNHLIFDPIGYVWFLSLQKIGFSLSALDSFEIISGVAAVVSVLIFHALLLEIGVRKLVVRLLAVGGLFASQGFLSMAVSQYYFMLQMPFLIGALYFAVRFVAEEKAGSNSALSLYGIGVLTAIASTLMFNNVFLVAALGLMVGLSWQGRMSLNFANTARVWGAAAIIGVPVFVIGYVASGSSDSFFYWLLSYQGQSESSLNELYGIEWTVKGIVVSLARACFNLFTASAIETAGLGTAVKAIIFREPLEFIPETGKLLLTLTLSPVIAGTVLALVVWAARRFLNDKVSQIALAWISAFFLFNTLWSSSGDLFWFQVLPVIWLLLIIYLGAASSAPFDGSVENWGRGRWKYWMLMAVVPGLLIVNTLQTVVPVSWTDLEAKNAEYLALMKDGDLEIAPGWDGYGWMRRDTGGPFTERITLMQMALQEKASTQHIQQLPVIVNNHLLRGKRVVIARLYDKDNGINPWYGLARLGWPRTRIQALLNNYCHKEIGRVDGVVFREVFVCPR